MRESLNGGKLMKTTRRWRKGFSFFSHEFLWPYFSIPSSFHILWLFLSWFSLYLRCLFPLLYSLHSLVSVERWISAKSRWILMNFGDWWVDPFTLKLVLVWLLTEWEFIHSFYCTVKLKASPFFSGVCLILVWMWVLGSNIFGMKLNLFSSQFEIYGWM